MNIGCRLGSVSTPTINDDTPAPPIATQRLRLKRPRLEVDDDDIIITNSNGH